MKTMLKLFIKLMEEEYYIIWKRGMKKIALNLIGIKFKGNSNNYVFIPYVILIYTLLIIFAGVD